ncbi:MAG: NADH:ubiquinone reductase (Na(+)-transporting) subunit B, partial [Candidatus Marinimicrobia bacterium CG_4_9_14_3_um_filter_48_9]
MSLDQIFTKLEESLSKSPFKLFEPLVEATHTFLLTPGKATRRGPHVRDNIDLKRYMFMVIVALL